MRQARTTPPTMGMAMMAFVARPSDVAALDDGVGEVGLGGVATFVPEALSRQLA